MTDQTQPEAETPAAPMIFLDYPITRGSQVITEVALARPTVRTLKGLDVFPLVRGSTDAVAQLLPRITNPPLTRSEVEGMDAADIGACAGTVAGFFLSRKEREDAGLT